MNLRKVPPFQTGVARSLTALVLPVFVGFMLTTPVHVQAESAGSAYKHGQSAEARENYDAAYEYYKKAVVQDPKDSRYKVALNTVRSTAGASHVSRGRKLALAGDKQSAMAEFLRATEIDPSNEAARQEIAKLRALDGEQTIATDAVLPMADSQREQMETIGAPVILKPMSNEPLTLHMSEDAKVVYQAVGRAAGINVLFDPDFSASKRVQVDLNNVSLMDALRILGTLSNTFWRPITANTVFVAQNTQAKRRELDEQAVQTFYLTNVAQQNDLNDVNTAIRSIMPTAKVYAIAGQNAIIMRGTPDELLLAQKIISDIDKPRAEVVVDVAIMEVSKTWEKTLGIQWPTSASVAISTSTSSSSSSSSTSTPTVYDLKNIKASDLAVTLGSATLNMLLSDANTSILQNPRLRATDGQKATMKIGSKIPVATGSYSTGTSTTTVSSLVNTQFQYIDVGVNIEMTPTIHYGGEVTLKAKVEVSSETGTVTISDVSEPIISQRVVDQTIRLHEGEATLIGGIQDHQIATTYTGWPGLSTIPVLKYIFGSKDKTVKNDDLVFVLVPHIVRSQDIKSNNLRPVDTGSGQTNIELYHTSAPVVTERPAVPNPHAATGVVASPSATQAAPKILQQLKQDVEQQANPAAVPVATNGAPQTAAVQANAAGAGGGLSFVLTAPAEAKAGSSFQIPVTLSGGTNLASVPLQLHYDASKMTLTNVAAGNLLNRDGQAVALVHRDDGPGNLTVVSSRPPGAAGISGSGVVCVLSFEAKAAGTTTLAMTRAGAIDAAQQQVPAATSQLNLTIH